MNRLFGIKIDTEKWVGERTAKSTFDSYKLWKKDDSNTTYEFKDVMGINQVSEDEFLVLREIMFRWEYILERFKLIDGEKRKIFCMRSSILYFISDDRILFAHKKDIDGEKSMCCGNVYSISDNNILEEAKWLEGSIIDMYGDKLCIEKNIKSHKLKLNDQKLIFTVDPETFQPNSNCYSLIRDSFIEVNSKEDIDRIFSEDEKKIRAMENQLWNEREDKIGRAREKVLNINRK